MLELQLRQEFQNRRLKGTAIELTNNSNTGATQIPASDFLRITYPSHDVLKTIEAAGPNQGQDKECLFPGCLGWFRVHMATEGSV